jgi:pyruvate/2-oxoglutarate dehydrogenase complex dihydrolipoamide dehydrogenase (E3) component
VSIKEVDKTIMRKPPYDIIVIGCGSGGLSVGLFMNKAGFRVLMISKSDHDIGGDCLNDGCVPSKALIHVAEIIYKAGLASEFGMQVDGTPDLKKVMAYVQSRQEIIRKHENADWLRNQGISVALGYASFAGKNDVEVGGQTYSGKKIVIATGSTPAKLKVPGSEKVNYLDNENIFELEKLPGKLLVVGGGPIGVELAQAASRLGSKVVMVHSGKMILDRDENSVAEILLSKLRQEGIAVELNTTIREFISSDKAIIKHDDGSSETIEFDAVFAAVGRDLNFQTLCLDKAGILVKDDKIIIDKYLRTSNKNVFVCGDVAGDLKFSHAAEFHARILINNFFSPFKEKLDNQHMSWVTFSDPQLATFGFNEKDLSGKKLRHRKIVQDFNMDDRAIVGNFEYARLILYLSPKNIFGSQKILGGTMVAPGAGEMIQELMLANSEGISVNAIFDKIYPYPVASRINQQLVVRLKEESLTATVRRVLKTAFKFFG